MGMRAKLWSLSGLSTELQRNPRTVARALRDTPPDGHLGRHPGWLMSTAAAALARYELNSAQLAHRSPAQAATVALISAIEPAVMQADQLVRRLRSASTVEERRKILETDGKAVGSLNQAFQRQLRRMVRPRYIGRSPST